ncbi:hypothetical protein AB1286_20050 [Trinickia sp. NRRL B-1857]
MSDLTQRDLRLIDLRWAIRTTVLGVITAALAIAPFIEHGRLVAALIGG